MTQIINRWLLTLMVRLYQNKAKYISLLGNVNENLNFELDSDVGITRGCGATLMGQFWYFGGSGPTVKQVNSRFTRSKVNLY